MGKMLHPEYVGTLGPVIQACRERAGLTRSELAGLVGYSTQSIERRSGIDNLERGIHDPLLSAVFKICEVLGVEFVDAVADEMFKAAKRGIEHRRDELLTKAGEESAKLKTAQRKKLSA